MIRRSVGRLVALSVCRLFVVSKYFVGRCHFLFEIVVRMYTCTCYGKGKNMEAVSSSPDILFQNTLYNRCF